MGATVSRAALAVCVILVTGAAGACGGGGTPHAQAKPSVTAKASATGKAAAARPATRVWTLSQRELERALIVAKDVPGWKTGTVKARRGDGTGIPPMLFDVSKMPRSTSAACEPVFNMTQSFSRHPFSAVAEQGIKAVSAKDQNYTEMYLASYGVTAATQMIKDLRTSLRTCSSFPSPVDGTDWTDVVPLAGPRSGDEAVAYRITQSVAGDDSNDDDGTTVKTPFHFVVVRSGATIAVFLTLSLATDTRPPQVSMDVVTAQITKLEQVR